MKSLLFVFRCCWEVCFVMVLVILGYSTQCHAIQLLRCIHMYMHIHLYIHTYISRHTYPSILKSIRIHLCMHSFKSVYAYTISIISFAKSNRYVLGFSQMVSGPMYCIYTLKPLFLNQALWPYGSSLLPA